MKIDLTKMRERKEHIHEIPHKEADLILWNYSHSCQYNNAWDEFTMMSRGLITDKEGNIVARPFKKFFNIGQTDETKLEALLQLGEPEIYDKLDGSLGILYFRAGVPHICTRGAFGSEQAQFATKWIQSWYERSHPAQKFLDGYTYLFEIIYPTNRIVVDYGARSELVLLSVVNTDTGEELNYETEADRLGLPKATRHGIGMEAILAKAKTLGPNEEGFVFRYPNGLRVKIKGEEYVRLHRLITGFSNKSIWELLMNNQPFDEFLERVPDEFYAWVKKTKEELEVNYKVLKDQALVGWLMVRDLPTRKDQAIEVMKNHKGISSLVFGMLDDKDISQDIWKRLRPVFSKPFKTDIDA